MSKDDSQDNISEQDLIKILQMGDIKMKRLTVGGHSSLDGIELKWTSLPKDILIGPLVRKDKVILPDGDTRLRHGDDLIIFGREKDLEITKELLTSNGFFDRMKRKVARLFKRNKEETPADEKEESTPREK